MKDKIIEALARGYCTTETENKSLDATYINCAADEIMKVFQDARLSAYKNIMTFGRHIRDCSVVGGYDYPCNCGYDKACDELR